MNICILTLIKNEHDYLNDFLEYHTKLGIDVFLFEDINSISHSNITAKHNNVFLYSLTELYTNDEIPQLIQNRNNHVPPQTDFINRGLKFIHNMHKYDWCFLIDIDEYITCNDSLPNILQNYNNFDAVICYWKNFGSSGHIYKPIYDKPIYQIYTTPCGYEKHTDEKFHNLMKFCVNLNKYKPTMKFKIHNALVNWVKVDFTYKRCDIVFEPLYLRHYITKSFEEYCYKVYVRGMLHPSHRNIKSYFEMNPDMEKLIRNDKNFRPYFADKYGVKLPDY